MKETYWNDSPYADIDVNEPESPLISEYALAFWIGVFWWILAFIVLNYIPLDTPFGMFMHLMLGVGVVFLVPAYVFMAPIVYLMDED